MTDRIGDEAAALERAGKRENTLIFLLRDNVATTERRAGLGQRPATAGKNGPQRGAKPLGWGGCGIWKPKDVERF